MAKIKAVILVIPENFGKHFTYQALIHSDRAVLIGVKNEPETQEQVDNLKALVDNVLDPVRELIERKVYPHSGFRSEMINKIVGGSINPPSQHMKGEAADVTFKLNEGETYLSVAEKIRESKIPVDQCIVEKRGQSQWLHLSHKRAGENRGEFLTYTPEEGYNPF